MTFYDLLWYFTIYSFLGWCSEVIFATVTTGKFVNRGFLNGPVCPIYGFGMSLVLLVLLPFSDNIPLLFIGGYICLKFSILWGLCVVVVIRIVHTAIASLVHWIPFTLGAILVGIFIALFITDTIVTVLTIRKLNEKLTVINDMSARLRKESDAISNGLGRLTLLADEKITEQKQEFNEKARPVLEEKLQAQRAQLSEKYEEYRASLEDRRVKAQKSAEDLRAQWNSVTSKLQRHTQRRLLRAFPTMKNDRADEALRRLRAWMDEKKEN
ncbi:putative ABC transporter permease [Hominenteromicrobium sp.]|uniref:putative ABC transporter permease n=1 Tax=Hominenteromicrobium sp. TaxID=3073581 RepID=UPI003AF10375